MVTRRGPLSHLLARKHRRINFLEQKCKHAALAHQHDHEKLKRIEGLVTTVSPVGTWSGVRLAREIKAILREAEDADG